MEKSDFKKWSWSSFFLGILVAALCLFIVNETTKEITATASLLTSKRVPASIDHHFDFSNLAGLNLEGAAKERLMKSVKIENAAHMSLIELGNFVLLDTNKEKAFACGVYDHVTLSFEAEGVAVDGGKPVLTVDSPCDVAGNINQLSPIKIPFEKIKLTSPALASGLSIPGEKNLKLQTKNAPENWPTHWVLTEITLSRTDASLQNLHISQDEVAYLKNKPVIMNW
jgi:hypothetical protein